MSFKVGKFLVLIRSRMSLRFLCFFYPYSSLGFFWSRVEPRFCNFRGFYNDFCLSAPRVLISSEVTRGVDGGSGCVGVVGGS